MSSIAMDDSTVTETWARCEEGKGDDRKDEPGTKPTKTDDAGNSDRKKKDRGGPSAPKRPAARTFQGTLYKRARKPDPEGKKGKRKYKLLSLSWLETISNAQQWPGTGRFLH